MKNQIYIPFNEKLIILTSLSVFPCSILNKSHQISEFLDYLNVESVYNAKLIRHSTFSHEVINV